MADSIKNKRNLKEAERGSKNEQGGRRTADGKGVTTRSGKSRPPKQGGRSQSAREDAIEKRDGPTRSTGLNVRTRGREREASTGSESEGSRSGSRSRSRSWSRSRSGRDTERETEEEEEESAAVPVPDAESVSEEDIIVVDDDVRPPRLDKKELAQARKVMAETEAMVEQLGVRGDCPSLATHIRQEGGQGRPAETGGHYVRQLQKASRELLDRARELRVLRDATVPANLSQNRRAEEVRVMRELKDAPAVTLPAVILETVNGLDLVSERSGSLKGEYRSRLSRSAAAIKAATTLLVQRYEDPDTGLERDVEMESLRSQNLQMQRELQELQRRVEELQTLQTRQEERSMVTRSMRLGERGGKRKRPLPPIQSSSSEGEDRDRGKEGHTGFNERTGLESEALMEEVGEGTGSSRNRVMEEIEREGMPEARRPTIRGRSAVLDPAVPPAEQTPRMEADRDPSMEQRLATMLVECVRDTVGKMEKRIRSDLAPQLSGKEGEKDLGIPPPLRKEAPAITGRKVVGKDKGGRERPAAQPRAAPPVPTSAGGNKTSWSQVLGRRIGAQSQATPPVSTSTGGNKALRSQVPGRKAGLASAPAPTPAPTKGAGKARPQIARNEGTQAAVTGSGKGEGWTQVTGKRSRGKAAQPGQGGKSGDVRGVARSRSTPPQQGAGKKRRKEPRTAAVTLTCPDGEYADCMGTIRRRIQLETLGITRVPNVRRTATGAISLEIAGLGKVEKADALAEKMSEVLAGREGVRVGRPTMTADVRLTGFEESVREDEIGEALAKRGNTGLVNFRVGPIRKMANGLCSTVVSCPLAVANDLVKDGKLALGWSLAKTEMLEKRPLQCYKCMEMGHTRATCRGEKDRTGACYRCGEHGHPARECQAPVCCTVCRDKGLPHGHRIGGPACKGCKPGRKGRTAEKKEVGNAAKKGGEKAKGKGHEKPKAILNLEVSGFRVTEGGKLIAGVMTAQEPPPPRSRDRRRGRRRAEKDS